MKKAIALVLIVLASQYMLFSQPAVARKPKPGPEHQKLAGLVGNWTTAGETAESPFGPAEKWTGTIRSKWLMGRFAVVRHVNEKHGVSGRYTALDVITYDGTAKAYTWYEIDNKGWSGLIKATIAGNTMAISFPLQAKGKSYKCRGTLKGLGSDKITFASEYSEDGKAWKPLSRSTDTRVKAK